MTINWISREEWNARPPNDPPIKIKVPTGYVYVHHVGGTMTMRAIQDLHMDDRGWNDVAYNFMIEKDGRVNVGRGFGIKGGHVLDPENSVCHGICLNGNFQTEHPTDPQLLALTELLWEGHADGQWQIDVRGHRDTMSTDCPGDNLYPLLPTIEQAAKQWASAPITPTPTPPKEEILMNDAINFYVRRGDGAILFVMRNLNNAEQPVSSMGVSGPFTAPEGAIIWNVANDDFSYFQKYRVDV